MRSAEKLVQAHGWAPHPLEDEHLVPDRLEGCRNEIIDGGVELIAIRSVTSRGVDAPGGKERRSSDRCGKMRGTRQPATYPWRSSGCGPAS